MKWAEEELLISESAAAAISAGMKSVALADGEMHQAELALIRSFAIPSDEKDGAVASEVIGDGGVREAYLHSLVMVALADGNISSDEDQVIRRLAGEVGLGDDDVDRAIGEVKQWFLAHFAGVSVFADSVAEIAAGLGLEP